MRRDFRLPGRAALRALCVAAALAAPAIGPAIAQMLEGETAAPASSLSTASRAELSRQLALQDTWRAADMFDKRLPHIPADSLDRYLLWNEVALDTTAIDHTPLVPHDIRPRFAEQYGPTRSSRAMAIVHIALFEAVNTVTKRFKSYTGFHYVCDPDVSLDAAIARSAHDTLLALYPAQQVRLDALLAQDLAVIPDARNAVQAGEALGAAAAQSILVPRSHDGSQYTEQRVGTGPDDFHLTNAPGFWSPDPVSGMQTALGSKWGNVTPFVLTDADQFRLPPPPSLESHEYGEAYKEVYALGGDPLFGTPTRRTARQTFIGRFWGYDATPALCSPPRLYNMIARTLAMQQGVTNVAELARFMALVNTAMADAIIATWESKWHYQLWRPVVAIRHADQATNPDTIPDPTWYPLGGPATNTTGPNLTPPFPAYPSAHASTGGALFEVLRAYWPDKTRFTFVSDEYNGHNRDASGAIRPRVPQTFASFSEAEHDNAWSRIYDGIHWRFDATGGIEQGQTVARYVLAHAFQRLDAHHHPDDE